MVGRVKKPKYCKKCHTQLRWCRGIIYPATVMNTSKAGIHIKGNYYCDTCKEPRTSGTFNIPCSMWTDHEHSNICKERVNGL